MAKRRIKVEVFYEGYLYGSVEIDENGKYDSDTLELESRLNDNENIVEIWDENQNVLMKG